MDIGTKIRRERIKKGLSQRHLAKQIGISNTYLSDIEVGRTLPSIRTLLKISKELETDINTLCKG
jgi:transcriptional regulator with XRE-family HTH domain